MNIFQLVAALCNSNVDFTDIGAGTTEFRLFPLTNDEHVYESVAVINGLKLSEGVKKPYQS